VLVVQPIPADVDHGDHGDLELCWSGARREQPVDLAVVRAAEDELVDDAVGAHGAGYRREVVDSGLLRVSAPASGIGELAPHGTHLKMKWSR
jgi:hypothetical protein